MLSNLKIIFYNHAHNYFILLFKSLSFGPLCSPELHLFDQKYRKKLILWNIITFYKDIFRNVIYFCDQSWIFSIITPVFSVTWSFRNIFSHLILSMLKTVELRNIFVETIIHFLVNTMFTFIWNRNLSSHYKWLYCHLLPPCWKKVFI